METTKQDPNIKRIEHERTTLNQYLYSTRNCKTIEEMRAYLTQAEENCQNSITKLGGTPQRKLVFDKTTHNPKFLN